MEIDDPYSPLGDAPQKSVVVRSLRSDPLADMHARSQIDQAQYLAGRHYQRLHERTELGQIGSIDTTKTPVDGGRWPELVTDGQRNAMNDLKALNATLGIHGAALMQDVLATGMFVRTAAAVRGIITTRGIDGLAFMFRQYLNVMASHLGYATAQVPTRILTMQRVTDRKNINVAVCAPQQSKSKRQRNYYRAKPSWLAYLFAALNV